MQNAKKKTIRRRKLYLAMQKPDRFSGNKNGDEEKKSKQKRIGKAPCDWIRRGATRKTLRKTLSLSLSSISLVFGLRN